MSASVEEADIYEVIGSCYFCSVHGSGKKVALYKENLLLRGCTIRNTEEVSGLVIYAGKRLFYFALCSCFISPELQILS